MSQSDRRFKHGLSHHRLATIWKMMKQRCENKNHTAYSRYGGRGINVCSKWHDDFVSFYNWAISHGYRKDLTIDRIDPNGNYEPSNCRWATPKEQGRNLRCNHLITIHGITKCFSEWAEETCVNYTTALCRLRRGWSPARAFNLETINKEAV